MELRKEVQEFAEAMEMQLQKHNDRPGWKDCNIHWLWLRIKQELDELRELLFDENGKLQEKINITKVLKEAADVGNFCMMIADVMKENWIKKSADLLDDVIKDRKEMKNE